MSVRAAVTTALFLGTLASCGRPDTALERPSAMALGPDGALAVADAEHRHVVLIQGEQRRVLRGRGDGGYWEAFALDWGPQGQLVALARRYTAAVDETTWELVHFEDGGVHQHPLTVPEPELLDWSMGLAVADDAVFTTGLAGGAVVRFDTEGRYLEHHSAMAPSGPLAGPSAVIAVGDGLWVVEHFGHRIRRLDRQGRELRSFGSEGSGQGQLRFPRALAACGEAWLAVADMGNFRVQRFGSDGSFLGGFTPPAAAADVPVQLVDLAVSADCERIYLADGRGGRVLVTTPEGELLEILE